ncbi:MAG: hypothetical protein K6T74_15750 [Geminicoccaceae bacterium]|nr:hypothetical protein [Geminicoccaceae bacterium]
MHECWPAALSCLVAGGLSAMLQLLLADLLHLLRRLGVEGWMLAGLGWPVAALLYLRLRLERGRSLGSPVDPTARPPSHGRPGTREGGEPGGG